MVSLCTWQIEYNEDSILVYLNKKWICLIAILPLSPSLSCIYQSSGLNIVYCNPLDATCNQSSRERIIAILDRYYRYLCSFRKFYFHLVGTISIYWNLISLSNFINFIKFLVHWESKKISTCCYQFSLSNFEVLIVKF